MIGEEISKLRISFIKRLMNSRRREIKIIKKGRGGTLSKKRKVAIGRHKESGKKFGFTKKK